MKRILFLLLLVLAVTGWSQTFTFMDNGVAKFAAGEDQFRGPDVLGYIINNWAARHPGVRVNIVHRDVSRGSLTFDAMLAAGNPPDVWLDATGYFPAYMNDNYALQLEKYLDLSRYRPDLLALGTRNGHVYTVPLANIATGMAVNLDMLKQIGYTMPPLERWTTTEYLNLAQRLKVAGIPATIIQGKEGLNGWTDIWLYAHGAEFFRAGDYSRTTINSPEAVAGLTYIKTIIDRGYTPAPLEHNDDDLVELFTTAKVFSGMMQNGHITGWIPQQLAAGKLAKAFDFTFVEFPHVPGRSHTPVSGYQAAAIAHKSNLESRNQLVASLLGEVVGMEAQWYWSTITGGFPTLMNFAPDIGTAADPAYKAIAGLAATAGVYKQWPDGPQGQEVRRLWRSLSEQWLRGRLTSQALLSQFEAEANRILR